MTSKQFALQHRVAAPVSTFYSDGSVCLLSLSGIACVAIFAISPSQEFPGMYSRVLISGHQVPYGLIDSPVGSTKRLTQRL
jgi:hypothetical protein